MDNELFDIYDENNKPLGFTATQLEVHQRGMWHRTVHVYLVGRNGDFLVRLRSPFKDHAPNRWDTRFGGHVTADHDYLQTAVEELREEIGLSIQAGDLILGEVVKHDGPNN